MYKSAPELSPLPQNIGSARITHTKWSWRSGEGGQQLYLLHTSYATANKNS